MSVLIAASALYFATIKYYPEDVKNRAVRPIIEIQLNNHFQAEEDNPLLSVFDTHTEDRFLEKFDSYLDEEFV